MSHPSKKDVTGTIETLRDVRRNVEDASMKVERGICGACGHRTATRDGEAADGRPQYRCVEDRCGQTWTHGHQGETWDTQPSPTRKVVSP